MKKKERARKKITTPIYRVTDNCVVNLKSANINTVKKVRISTVNGYDRYVCLIGKKKGSTVNIDGVWWVIGYIEYEKKRKTNQRNYSAMSHPLNNKVHFWR